MLWEKDRKKQEKTIKVRSKFEYTGSSLIGERSKSQATLGQTLPGGLQVFPDAGSSRYIEDYQLAQLRQSTTARNRSPLNKKDLTTTSLIL